MADEALAKAAYQAYWRDTCMEERWAEEKDKQRWCNVARAVLEAAGYEPLRAVADAAKAHMEQCAVLDCMSDDDPLLCEDVSTCYRERLRAALQRAGKEA